MTAPVWEWVARGFDFCEAPRAARDGTVWFSDLSGGGLYRKRPGAPVETLLAARRWIGGATLDARDAVIASGEGGLVLVENGIATPLLAEIAGEPIVAVNDIEADANGALYGGTIDFAAIFDRGEPPRPGMLFHLTPGGSLRILRDDVIASNGIGFSPDGATMYHCECEAGIWAWGMRDGIAAGPPAMFAPASDCDGLAVDAEGGVWVAFWRDALLRRYRPDAVIDREIALPFTNVISLSFGGADLTDLYVAVGGANPGEGGIIRVAGDTPGLPAHRSAFAEG